MPVKAPSQDEHPPDDGSERPDRELAARLRDLRALHRGLAHDIRGPLNAMVLQLELLRSDVGQLAEPDSARRRIDLLAAELDRLRAGTEDLLSLVAPPGREADEWDASALAGAVARLLAPRARLAGIRLEPPPTTRPLPIPGDRGEALAVLLGLALECLSALSDGSRLGIEVGPEDGGTVTFRLHLDAGDGGVTPSLRAARATQSPGTEVRVEERNPGGAVVTLRLPQPRPTPRG